MTVGKDFFGWFVKYIGRAHKNKKGHYNCIGV